MGVQHRNTSRNSFPDMFLHDFFAHHHSHTYRFQALLKNTLKNSWFFFLAFSSSAHKLWNALPQTIKEACSLAAFHRRLKMHLFSE